MSDVLSLPRMARRLAVPAAWLREQADAGKVPCLRAGKRYLFSPPAVVEALAVIAAKSGGRAGDVE